MEVCDVMKNIDFGIRAATLVKLLHLSESWFPQLYIDDSNTELIPTLK